MALTSAVPAPMPHSSVLSVDRVPVGPCSWFLSTSKPKKRLDTLGTEKKSREGSPRYSPRTPSVRMVSRAHWMGPSLALSWNSCSCVFTYSVG